MALIIIGINITELPALLVMIVKNAFGIESVVGGGIGVAIEQGKKRGLFSNAGFGSAPNIAATAYATHPVSQVSYSRYRCLSIPSSCVVPPPL